MWRDKTYSQRLSDLLKVFGIPVQLYRENDFVRQGLAFEYPEIISVFWDYISCSISLPASVAVHDKTTSFWKGGLGCQTEPCPPSLVLLSCALLSLLCCPQVAHQEKMIVTLISVRRVTGLKTAQTRVPLDATCRMKSLLSSSKVV